MVEKIWFVNKCKENNLSTQRISKFGRYAVNANGDLMVMNDEYEFLYLSAEDIASCDFDYDTDMEIAIGVLDDNSTKIYFDLVDFCHAYKEAVLRNKYLDPAIKGVTKDSPTRVMYDVTELIRSWSDFDTEHHHTRVIPGIYEEVETEFGGSIISGKPICNLSLPRGYQRMKGYRFALKVININSFCDLFGFIGFSDQHTPFEMMHDLEKKVAYNWKKYGEVLSSYEIDYLGDKLVIFEFSHFELDVYEPDESYRCFHACYRYVGTIK